MAAAAVAKGEAMPSATKLKLASSPAPPCCAFDAAALDGDNLNDCERCGLHWARCTCGSP